MTKTPTLTTSGVVLRPLTAADAGDLYAAHADPDVHQYWATPRHESVAETRDYIEATLAIANSFVWAITERGGEALGRVALFIVRDGVGEFGILMRREAQGRGLASTALKLIEDYAFTQLGLHRLQADVDPDNSASLSLFLRAGFEREGLLRGYWRTHLGVRDSVMLSKLREQRR
jgi:RimJ/RimL family protein N-acetyltransferase